MIDITCPDKDRLRAFLTGDLQEAELNAIASHLNTCSACQAAIDTADGTDDTLASLLRRRSRDEFIAEPECRQAMALIETLDPSRGSSADAGQKAEPPRPPD